MNPEKIGSKRYGLCLSFLLAGALFLLSCADAFAIAPVPCMINYQGRLKNSGLPVNGMQSMEFKLYDVSSGGSAFWDSTGQSVAVSSGLFNYVLTGGSPDLSTIDWSAHTPWLEVQIPAGTPLTPREQIKASAYSLYTTSAAVAMNLVGGGTGAVPFQSNINATTFDTSNLVWDNTNKRLGIVTNVPDQKLSVNGNIDTTGVVISSGTGNNYFWGKLGVGTSAPSSTLSVSSSSWNGTDLLVKVSTGTGASEIDYFTVGQNGNMGINNYISYSRWGTLGGYIGSADSFPGPGGLPDLGMEAMGSIYFITNNTSQTMALLNTGYVGIGNSSPTGKFQVLTGGSTFFIDNTAGNVGIGTTGPLGGFDVSGVTGASSWSYFRGNTGVNPNTSFNQGLSVGWNKSNGGGETNLVFGVGAGSGPRLEIAEWNGTTYTADMVVKTGGNVGVGTTNPASKFDLVNGSITVSGTNAGIAVKSFSTAGYVMNDVNGNLTGGNAGGR